jgi:SAM-dependent methyltransferase
MIRTKPLDMNDLTGEEFDRVNRVYNKMFGPSWPAVPCRRWEYVAAIVFSDIHYNINEDLKICDAGSGPACIFTRYLARNHFTVDAFDVGTAGAQNFTGGGMIRYHDMNMVKIEFEDAVFDYVFAMSSIEHINAGKKFNIPGTKFDGDVGDTQAMLELCRILKPGGVLVLTTDYAQNYIKPPGPYGTHRVYNWQALLDRLVNPAVRKYKMRLHGGFDAECDWENIKQIEPLGWPYTEFILTMKKTR